MPRRRPKPKYQRSGGCAIVVAVFILGLLAAFAMGCRGKDSYDFPNKLTLEKCGFVIKVAYAKPIRVFRDTIIAPCNSKLYKSRFNAGPEAGEVSKCKIAWKVGKDRFGNEEFNRKHLVDCKGCSCEIVSKTPLDQ